MSRTLLRLKGEVGFLLTCCRRKGPHLTLRGESPGFSQVAAANLGFLSNYDWELRDTFVGPREIQYPCELRGASWDSFEVSAEADILIWSCTQNLRFLLQCHHWSRGSSGVSTGVSGLVSCGDMQVHSPLELEKHCQAYCLVDVRITGFLWRC